MAVKALPEASGGQIDRAEDIALNPLGIYRVTARKAHFDGAAFVFSTAGAVDVAQANDHAGDEFGAVVQRIVQAPQDMAPHFVGQVDLRELNLYFHWLGAH